MLAHNDIAGVGREQDGQAMILNMNFLPSMTAPMAPDLRLSVLHG